MMRVPPKPVRRLLIAPLVVLLDVALLALSPFVVVLAALVSPLFGGARSLRMALIVLAYVRHHLEAVVRLLRLRGARDQSVHYEVMRRFVSGVYDAVVRLARVEVHVDETSPAHRALSAAQRPVVLLSRHAGEGDTLLVVHEMLCRHRRAPRVVMHEALQLDPLIDLLGNRLPNRFVDPRGGDTEREIAAMARELDAAGALIIFPEGGNFSHERRRRGIERLRRAGHEKQAAAAHAMRHVSAPRPGGALAAIDAAPHADVVIMGHVGFPNGLGEVWRLLPHRQAIEIKLWHEPAESIPEEHGARIEWLFDRWRRLDAWVEERNR